MEESLNNCVYANQSEYSLYGFIYIKLYESQMNLSWQKADQWLCRAESSREDWQR